MTASLLTALSVPLVVADDGATGTSCGIGVGYANVGQCTFTCVAGETVHVYAIGAGIASGGYASCPGTFASCTQSFGDIDCEGSDSPNTGSGTGVCWADVAAVQVQCWSR